MKIMRAKLPSHNAEPHILPRGPTPDVIDQVTASILEARKGLEQTLTDLEKLPAIDPHSLAFSAHALQNYLTIMSGTTELLPLKLTGHPAPEVRAWRTHMQQATEMMARIVAD